ncbi:MAG: membrane dipeptidase, partial [Pseudomonadota bacterium]|nr:membrane dipeptidase [Pseudomonadota bacterium]
GSDYDGVGDSLPIGLKDVASFPSLVQGLLDRGYSRTDIEKILSGNLLRVWQQVEEYAEEHAATH